MELDIAAGVVRQRSAGKKVGVHRITFGPTRGCRMKARCIDDGVLTKHNASAVDDVDIACHCVECAVDRRGSTKRSDAIQNGVIVLAVEIQRLLTSEIQTRPVDDVPIGGIHDGPGEKDVRHSLASWTILENLPVSRICHEGATLGSRQRRGRHQPQSTRNCEGHWRSRCVEVDIPEPTQSCAHVFTRSRSNGMWRVTCVRPVTKPPPTPQLHQHTRQTGESEGQARLNVQTIVPSVIQTAF